MWPEAPAAMLKVASYLARRLALARFDRLQPLETFWRCLSRRKYDTWAREWPVARATTQAIVWLFDGGKSHE
jgi:hypothetical protein